MEVAMRKRGIFIDFEGGEKVGKTTQIKRAEEYLRGLGYTVVVTREPGGGDPTIRQKLLRTKGVLTPEQELGLFCKDRRLHVENVIRPALEAGAIVLCDRFEPSSIAYQGYGRGLSIKLICEKSREARGDTFPDVIFHLDADPEIVQSREEATTRFDKEALEFHRRVREGFLAQEKEDPARWRRIDASLPEAAVWQEIRIWLGHILKDHSSENAKDVVE